MESKYFTVSQQQQKHATTTAKKCKKSDFDTKEQEICTSEWEREIEMRRKGMKRKAKTKIERT